MGPIKSDDKLENEMVRVRKKRNELVKKYKVESASPCAYCQVVDGHKVDSHKEGCREGILVNLVDSLNYLSTLEFKIRGSL